MRRCTEGFDMDSASIKEEPPVRLTDIEVMPTIGEIEGSNGGSVAEEMPESDELQNPQFYATIPMKEEQPEEFCNAASGDADNETFPPADEAVNRRDDVGAEPGTFRRVFQCPLCGKEYVRKDHLNYHMKIHAGFKDFKCQICEKEFGQSVHLENHSKVHTGKRDFGCEICGKSFVLKHHLAAHAVKIHGCDDRTVGGAKRCFKCDVCAKEFSRKDHFVYHMKIHTGLRDFKCEVCGKEFRQKTHLNNHSKLHTGEREFKCDSCGKEFSLKHHLTAHNLRIHAIGDG